jgi:formylglycine-generating enzyme required for sulfatase activity
MIKKHFGFLAVTLLSAQLVSAAEGTPSPAAAPPPILKDPATGIELVFVKGGCYLMGDVFGDPESGDAETADDQPVHEVCVDDFFIGKYEVTQGQWQALMGNNPSSDNTCGDDDCPVDRMSLSEAQEFFRRLNARSGGTKYRLPTEAEWEYAARSGGKSERFSGGNDFESVSWNRMTSGYSADPQVPAPWARPVGSKAPNGLGIYDMSGNVYELTSDWYDRTYYARSPRDNPTGPATGSSHVKRGGCAHGDPRNGRTSRRTQGDSDGDALLGIRVVRLP